MTIMLLINDDIFSGDIFGTIVPHHKTTIFAYSGSFWWRMKSFIKQETLTQMSLQEHQQV